MEFARVAENHATANAHQVPREGMRMIEIANEIYTATVSVNGGRSGRAVASDGRLDLDLSKPTDPRGTGTNPEQLFAAGYAACFSSALEGVARRRKMNVGQSMVEAKVVLGSSASGHYGLRVTLTVTVPSLDTATVRELADGAHQICPYSNATRGNIDVSIVVADTAVPEVPASPPGVAAHA